MLVPGFSVKLWTPTVTSTVPCCTWVSVPSQRSSVHHSVPRTVAAAKRPRVRNLPFALPVIRLTTVGGSGLLPAARALQSFLRLAVRRRDQSVEARPRRPAGERAAAEAARLRLADPGVGGEVPHLPARRVDDRAGRDRARRPGHAGAGRAGALDAHLAGDGRD